MGTTAWIITIGFAIATLLVAAVGVAVALSTRDRGEVETEAIEKRERTWFWIVIGLVTVLLLSTIFFTPYFDEAAGSTQRVQVEAFQFGFVVEPKQVRAGSPVEFVVRAREVNHGFAVYDDRDRLVFQVQAMPDYVHKVVHTFERPGSYRILCLEFCGVGHHAMTSRLEVTEG